MQLVVDLVVRIPFNSESDAFRMSIAFGLVLAASALVWALASPAYGVVVFASGVAAGIAFELSGRSSDSGAALREATHAPHPDAGATPGRHLLVVALEELGGETLREELNANGAATAQVDVLVPILASRSHYWSSDVDRERRDAEQRLAASLAWAAEQGFAARGEVGDPDPLVAIEDEMRAFGADEVVVVMNLREHRSWFANRMMSHLVRELDIPVREVVVDAPSHQSQPESGPAA